VDGRGNTPPQLGMFASPRISRRTSAVASNLSASTVAARPARTSLHVTTGVTAATNQPPTAMGGAAFAPGGGLVGGGWGTQGSLQHTLRMEVSVEFRRTTFLCRFVSNLVDNREIKEWAFDGES